jgi:hypothetical protein
VRPGDEEGTKNGKTSVYMYKFICATVIRAYRTRDNRKNSLKVEYFNFLPPSLPPFHPPPPPGCEQGRSDGVEEVYGVHGGLRGAGRR